VTTEELVDALTAELAEGGLSGGFLVRDLHTGDELGIDPDTARPIASLVKIPLGVATLERIHRGELAEDQRVRVAPGRVTVPGPTGISRFRHPAEVSVSDLVYLSVALSDGTASDALFDITPADRVCALLAELGRPGLTIRNTPGALSLTPAELAAGAEAHLAQRLAITGGTRGGGHRVPLLGATDSTRASAREVADWLDDLWRPRVPEEVADRMRELMAANVHRTRLAPEFASDASHWWSKTGTLLNLRHEAGVVEHADGSAFAVVALTESSVAAAHQPAAEALMGRIARRLHDELRRAGWADRSEATLRRLSGRTGRTQGLNK
jgi:beta-lactamase class A